jgi:hypothetical protein
MITPPKRDAGTAGRSFRVFTFQESLAAAGSFSTATAGCSLGFRPSKARPRKPRPGFRPISSHALCNPTGSAESPAPQSIARSPPVFFQSWTRKPMPGKEAFVGFLRPAFPIHSSDFTLRAMRSPFAALHITANCPAIFGEKNHSPGGVQDRSGAELLF